MVETHLNNLDDEMIKLLKIAGLKLVHVGVESSNNVVWRYEKITIKKISNMRL